MKANSLSGFKEIDHTADVALLVWAPTLSELFLQAAEGLFMLMRCDLAPDQSSPCELSLREDGVENLLVAFLNELLLYAEDKGIAYHPLEVRLDECGLHSCLQGKKILNVRREIKAVTYHQLKIEQSMLGFQTVITFDV